MKYIRIPIRKAVLYLTEEELTGSLPRELFAEALRRGKGIERRQQFKNRLEKMKRSGDLSDDY